MSMRKVLPTQYKTKTYIFFYLPQADKHAPQNMLKKCFQEQINTCSIYRKNKLFFLFKYSPYTKCYSD